VLPAGAFTIIGTTDTFDDVAPEEVRATTGDVDYLLAAANHYFTDAHLTEADVVSAWAGLRPLAATAGSASDPGSMSREHAITETSPGLVSVTGGKLTTYRAMSAQVVDVVQRVLGIAKTPSRTAAEPLSGGDIADVASAITEATRMVGDSAVGERLVHAYGSAWRNVWSLGEESPELRERIAPGLPYLIAELRYAVEHELARTLSDLLIRRTPLAFEMEDHGRDAARRMVPIVGTWLGWNHAAVGAAIESYDGDIARLFTIAPVA
ncbi:MAG: FAD-dependent oxidoreductase, partial [bacterium]